MKKAISACKVPLVIFTIIFAYVLGLCHRPSPTLTSNPPKISFTNSEHFRGTIAAYQKDPVTGSILFVVLADPGEIPGHPTTPVYKIVDTGVLADPNRPHSTTIVGTRKNFWPSIGHPLLTSRNNY